MQPTRQNVNEHIVRGLDKFLTTPSSSCGLFLTCRKIDIRGTRTHTHKVHLSKKAPTWAAWIFLRLLSPNIILLLLAAAWQQLSYRVLFLLLYNPVFSYLQPSASDVFSYLLHESRFSSLISSLLSILAYWRDSSSTPESSSPSSPCSVSCQLLLTRHSNKMPSRSDSSPFWHAL
jgi:hypothetical protein